MIKHDKKGASTPSELGPVRTIMIDTVQQRQAAKAARTTWNPRLLYSAVAIGCLVLGQLAGPVPCAQGEVVQSLTVNDLPTGRVSGVTQEAIIIDGVRHRLAPPAVVKWDLGGPASLDDIRPGDLVHFAVKNFEIVLVIIVQPG